jgi:membrane-bound lytic murein transglycosylase B
MRTKAPPIPRPVRVGRPAHAPGRALSTRWLALGAIAVAPAVVLAALHAAASSTSPTTVANALPLSSAAPLSSGAPLGTPGSYVWATDGVLSSEPNSDGQVVSGTTWSASMPDPAHESPVQRSLRISALAADGIPSVALDAYERAAAMTLYTDPSCHLPWPLLAAIGRVESDHGRFGGATLLPNGTSTKPIIGPPLNGTSGNAVILDTDNGRLDGDKVYDRAVGPMQFIPSTWARFGVDADGDGVANPFDINDAAAAAARYLCTAGGDLGTLAGQTRAVLAYNHSTTYLDDVLLLEHTYAAGYGVVVPVDPASLPVLPALPGPGSGTSPSVPPVDPGQPPAINPTPNPPPTSSVPHGSPSSSRHSTPPSTQPGSSSAPGSSSSSDGASSTPSGGDSSSTDSSSGPSSSDSGPSGGSSSPGGDSSSASSGGPGPSDGGTSGGGSSDSGSSGPGSPDPGSSDPGSSDPGTTDAPPSDSPSSNPPPADPPSSDPPSTDSPASNPATDGGSSNAAPADSPNAVATDSGNSAANVNAAVTDGPTS